MGAVNTVLTDSGLSIEYEQPGVVFASHGHTLINLWTTAAPDASNLSELGEATKRVHAASGQKISLLVVLGSAQIPDSSQRKILTSYYDAHAHCFGAVCQVLEGRGFWAQTVRGILMTVNVLQSSKYPSGVFQSVRAAEHWANKHNPSKQSSQSVATIVERLAQFRSAA